MRSAGSDENGKVSRLRVVGSEAPLTALSKSVREVTEWWIVSCTSAPGTSASAGSSRCSASTSTPCVAIHGGCETRLTPGAASGGGGAADGRRGRVVPGAAPSVWCRVVVVVVVATGRGSTGAVVVGGRRGARGRWAGGVWSWARWSGRSVGDRGRGRRRCRSAPGQRATEPSERTRRAGRSADPRGGRPVHSVPPEDAQPDGQPSKPRAFVEPERAVVVDLGVDERAARATDAHPAQARR